MPHHAQPERAGTGIEGRGRQKGRCLHGRPGGVAVQAEAHAGSHSTRASAPLLRRRLADPRLLQAPNPCRQVAANTSTPLSSPRDTHTHTPPPGTALQAVAFGAGQELLRHSRQHPAAEHSHASAREHRAGGARLKTGETARRVVAHLLDAPSVDDSLRPTGKGLEASSGAVRRPEQRMHLQLRLVLLPRVPHQAVPCC